MVAQGKVSKPDFNVRWVSPWKEAQPGKQKASGRMRVCTKKGWPVQYVRTQAGGCGIKGHDQQGVVQDLRNGSSGSDPGSVASSMNCHHHLISWLLF